MTTPQPGQIWQHYKHDPTVPNSYTYEIVALGYNTGTKHPTVIYKPLYAMPSEIAEQGLTVFTRDLDEFLKETELNGETRSKFTQVTSNS